jgi:hypothetical protein
MMAKWELGIGNWELGIGINLLTSNLLNLAQIHRHFFDSLLGLTAVLLIVFW